MNSCTTALAPSFQKESIKSPSYSVTLISSYLGALSPTSILAAKDDCFSTSLRISDLVTSIFIATSFLQMKDIGVNYER